MNPQTQAKLSKIIRYLRYYPKDLWLALQFLAQHWIACAIEQENSNQSYVEHLYRYFLRKSDQQSDIDFYVALLDQAKVSHLGLLFSFLMIPASWEQKLFHTQANFSHHLARLNLVQNELPSAQRILDLGGASGRELRGSLLTMGYPHRPTQIDIVDLPIEARFCQSDAVMIERHTTPEGTQIDYHYISMTDLSMFADNMFDFVWSGQSIEHISRIDVDLVMKESYRVLKPGGYFCLDTPNRQITRLQVRQGFIHPEHQYEYVPSELVTQLSDQGFIVVEQKAVSPMPMSFATARFSRLELIHSIGLGDDPNLGYSFYLSAQKPIQD
ncbi:MAG TPA: methyltransferase domain-containing protein [Leptolyngbya sp.]|jgi:ubiquinone/menaquinone biosynthesis C-methylase UbiE|nr:methyltransferase domain-containing protein [Leptolyngbya sp.]